ncbi:MAG: CGNR zinc finger domain-containing protein [Acidimicrobiales bacterium]
MPTDRFDEHCRDGGIGKAAATDLRDLRDDLRSVVEGAPEADAILTRWIDRLGLAVVVEDGAVRFHHDASPAGATLAVVLDTISTGTWHRLKACPDCRWVFYDRTRSGTKRWCLMNAAGPNGRGCGNIAKARRHRARQRGTGSA